jgi:GAF domain-containing protein
LSILVAFYLQDSGRLIVAPRTLSLIDPFLIIVQLGFIGLLLRHAMNSMLDAMKRAQSNERAQIEANQELEALRASLEQRVARRTRDLELRSSQLQAAAEVGRAVISILETEELIREVADLLHERFTLYHVGLFEVDSTGQWAEYRAGAGAGASALLKEGFRLAVGGNSMVGWCTANAQARVSQDVDTDAGHHGHPLVPRTRSEAALPLVAHGQVIGALSVQSDRPGTFDEATVSSLQIIADQVAVALDNARLFTESQQALEATRRAYGDLTRQAWIDLLRSRGDWGYSYAYRAITPAEGDWQTEMLQALETGQSVQGRSSGEPVLAMPLKVREEVVGVLSFHKAESEGLADAGDEAWTREEIGLLEQIIQQMGVALESAQFYEESQLRATQERTAREVTARMRETLDIDAVLRTSLQEMRQALGLSSMTIRLAEPPDGSKGN